MKFVSTKSNVDLIVGRDVAFFIGFAIFSKNVAPEVETLMIGDEVVRYVHRGSNWKCRRFFYFHVFF